MFSEAIPVAMNAHLRTTLKKGFFLTEESLIKLHDVVQKRVKSADPEGSVQFKVYRVDGMLLQFDTPSEVVSEENSPRNAINRIEMVADTKLCKTKLIFDPKEDIDLAIEASDRDLAYLLFSDIKDYLNSEVLKFRSFSFDNALSSRMLMPLMMLAFAMFSVFAIKDSPTSKVAAIALQSTDLHQKLNFLIENRMIQSAPDGFKYAIFGMVGLTLCSVFIGTILDKVFPRNIFSWGKAAILYERTVTIRDKVLWGIVIAFVIGILSTVVVDYVKSANSAKQALSVKTMAAS